MSNNVPEVHNVDRSTELARLVAAYGDAVRAAETFSANTQSAIVEVCVKSADGDPLARLSLSDAEKASVIAAVLQEKQTEITACYRAIQRAVLPTQRSSTEAVGSTATESVGVRTTAVNKVV